MHTQVLPRDFFNRLRKEKGDGFEDFIREHLIPIEGEMDKPQLGFSDAMLTKLQDEVPATWQQPRFSLCPISGVLSLSSQC